MASISLGALAPLLRKVEKPGRYVGGEFGAGARPGADLRVALSYPDLYEVGMSNSAVRLLYGLLNSLPGVACERVFAPGLDFEAELRGAGVPLVSLETRTPLSEFDILAFSLGYELTLTNAFAIMETGGIGLEAAHRGPGEPIVIAGGPAATNPAPLGPFMDAVFIGEAEGWAPVMIPRLVELKRRGAARADLLACLRDDPSTWYRGRTGEVRRALWRGFGTQAADARYPVPNMRVIQDHGTVEIMRGCPNACRFCHATLLYRPVRMKSPEIVAEEVRGLVDDAGYRQVTLSSLSSGDFGDIHGLVRGLNARYAPRGVSFSLPSLRVDGLGLGLLLEISEVRKSGLTFAVETARPEWQAAVRKTVTVDKTIEILREARARGWKAAKFYFMVGLPPSFEEDESGSIMEFLRAVKAGTGMGINVNVASFIPKPHTPWQRAAQLAEEPAVARIMAVRDGLKGEGFKIGFHAPILSLLEGIVARGDERAGLLVLDAYRRGARLDAWEEFVRLDLWRESIAAAGWDVLGETCRARTETEALPWAGISLALSRSVITDAADAVAHAAPTAPTASATPAAPVRPRYSQVPAASTPPFAGEVAGEGGPVPPAPSRPWQRVVFSFTKEGPAAYLAHLDLMTLIERALARTGLPVRFTEGFNPKPRLEFASPLSLGVESSEEIGAVDLFDADEHTAADFPARMNHALPDGIVVLRAAIAPARGTARRPSLMALYWGSDFEVTDVDRSVRQLRLPATGPALRKTLEADGTWKSASARRVATWAAGAGGSPLSYFDALCADAGPTGPAGSA